MSTSTARRRARRGVIRHWYLDIAVAMAAATAVVELLNYSRLGKLIISSERDFLAGLFSATRLHVITMGYNVLLVYGWGRAVTLVFTPSCSGIYAYTAFTVSSLTVVNVGLRQRLSAALVYAPLLLLANLVRILLATLVATRMGLEAFTVFHDYVGAGLYLLFYSILWLDWLYRSLQGARRGEGA